MPRIYDIHYADDFVGTIGIDVKLFIERKEIIFQNINDQIYAGNFDLLFPNDLKNEDILFQYRFKNNEQKRIKLTFNPETKKEKDGIYEMNIRIFSKKDNIILQNIHESMVFDQYIFKNGQIRHLMLVDSYGREFRVNEGQREEI